MAIMQVMRQLLKDLPKESTDLGSRWATGQQRRVMCVTGVLLAVGLVLLPAVTSAAEQREVVPDRHPVVCVSWQDVQNYVRWLSGNTQATYRLPSEEEWEGGASGSSAGCINRDDSEGTCQVGSFGFSELGLSDMLGNVWEWTASCFNNRRCSSRIIRGGNYRYAHASSSNFISVDSPYPRRRDDLGFRVALTLDEN